MLLQRNNKKVTKGRQLQIAFSHALTQKSQIRALLGKTVWGNKLEGRFTEIVAQKWGNRRETNSKTDFPQDFVVAISSPEAANMSKYISSSYSTRITLGYSSFPRTIWSISTTWSWFLTEKSAVRGNALQIRKCKSMRLWSITAHGNCTYVYVSVSKLHLQCPSQSPCTCSAHPSVRSLCMKIEQNASRFHQCDTFHGLIAIVWNIMLPVYYMSVVWFLKMRGNCVKWATNEHTLHKL